MDQETTTDNSEMEATLDPPGTVAVIGAGPLGIEAALYGRYLGYDVRLFEAVAVASSLEGARDQQIPMLPDRCASPLARSALIAQDAGVAEIRSPLSIAEWIDQVWLPLVETDLLRGRLRCPIEVVSAALSEHSEEAESEEDAEIPPDFRLVFNDGSEEEFEAVIVATGSEGRPISHPFSADTDYWFELRGGTSGDGEADFWGGLKRIVAIFASLGGRADLDLYRPLRGND